MKVRSKVLRVKEVATFNKAKGHQILQVKGSPMIRYKILKLKVMVE